MADDLARTSLSGVKWTYVATVVGAILQLGYTAVMGRLLSPEDFGLIAMALVFLRFGTYFAQMGVGSAVVQKLELTERDVRAAFTSTTVLGVLFTVGVWGLAPLALRLYDVAEVVPVIRGLTLTFLLNGLGITAQNILRRELRFKQIALAQIASHGMGYLLVGVSLALLGFGVWSLVGAALGQSLIGTMLHLALARHPIRPLLAWKEMRQLYAFGGRVSIIGFFEFIGESLDVLLIGRFLGPTSLGQYNRALLLVRLPLDQLISGLNRVLLPTFSRIQLDLERVRRAYLDILGISAAVVIPTASGLAVAAPEAVGTLLGDQWDDAARVLPFLAMAVISMMLTFYAAVICEALAVLNQKLVIQLVFVGVLAGLLLLGREQGLGVFAGIVALSFLGRHVAYLWLIGRVARIAPRDIVLAHVPGLAAAALVTAGIALFSGAARAATLPDPLVFSGQIATGAALFVFCVWWGPLVSVRRRLEQQLRRAGALDPDSGRMGRALGRLMNAGR